jgi:hypothetical protein
LSVPRPYQIYSVGDATYLSVVFSSHWFPLIVESGMPQCALLYLGGVELVHTHPNHQYAIVYKFLCFWGRGRAFPKQLVSMFADRQAQINPLDDA